MQTYLFPKHSEKKIHEDGVFARVLLTQRVYGLHYYNLEERGASQKEDCQAEQKKERLNFVNLVLFPGLEATILPLVIQ